jgi:MoxR-like ATPase
MSTPALIDPTTIPRGTVSQALVQTVGEVFSTKPDAPGFLATYNVEREDEIDLSAVALMAGIDPLFIGDPGVGKTWMIELILMCLEGTSDRDFFNTMVFKETPADDILGPRSLPAMKQGRIERLTDGYLPTAVVAYLDEIFKASPTLVNALLDVMAQRKLKVGSDILSLKQLLCIFGSSNELTDREDMWPFRDRWAITKWVKPVATPEGRARVLRIQDEYQAGGATLDLSNAPKLSLVDIHQARAEVRRIVIPDALNETMVEAWDRLEQAGIAPSTRRFGQMQLAVKARAWLRGEGEASSDDMIVLQHMAWNHPDHASKAHDIIIEFASQFARKAAQMRQALEPISTELDRVRHEITENGGEPTDQQMQTAFETLRSLKALRRDARSEIDKGRAQGQDVRDLETVLDDIARRVDWVEQTLIGE